MSDKDREHGRTRTIVVPTATRRSTMGTPPATGGDGPRAPVVSSGELLAGGRELVIRHGTEEYRLRLTGNNKLILTK